jgi:hypothetical protein
VVVLDRFAGRGSDAVGRLVDFGDRLGALVELRVQLVAGLTTPDLKSTLKSFLSTSGLRHCSLVSSSIKALDNLVRS